MFLANLPTYDASGENMTATRGLKIDPASVESFLKQYGLLHRMDVVQAVTTIEGRTYRLVVRDVSKNKHPELIEVKSTEPIFSFVEHIESVAGAQLLLRQAWSRNLDTINKDFNDGTLAGAFKIASFEILQNYAARRSGEVVLATEDLWQYMRYLFLIDFADQRTGVCERKDCPSPYFVRQRKGQRYCSHDCAVLENVRRFRSKGRKK